MRKNLVIVAAGDNSLHPEWVAAERSYDLCVIYYGRDPARLKEYRESSDKIFQGSGLKVQLARNFILSELFFKNNVDFARYDYVWFPDDDIAFPDGPPGLERLFDTAEKLKADIFQPAIQNEHYSEESTSRIPGAYCHRVNLAEIMAHGFSGEIFSRAYLPAVHAMDYLKSGWGVEQMLKKIGEAQLQRALRTFVIDCCPVIHTRPVGAGESFVHNQGRWEGTFIPPFARNRYQTFEVFSSLDEVVSRSAEFNELDASDLTEVQKAPSRIRAFQARQTILAAGLQSLVEAAVANASAEIQNFWYTTDAIDRDDPDLNALATSFGLTSEQIDDLFRKAAMIESWS